MVERVVSEVGEALPEVEIRWEGTFGAAGGDEGLLRQALLNLARNAAEACAITAGGGLVVVGGDIVHGEEGGVLREWACEYRAGSLVKGYSEAITACFAHKAQRSE